MSFGRNVEMNTDSSPPLPQNETAAAVSLANPKIAVWSVPVFLDTELGCQLTELPIS